MMQYRFYRISRWNRTVSNWLKTIPKLVRHVTQKFFAAGNQNPNNILFKINWIVSKDLFAVSSEQNA